MLSDQKLLISRIYVRDTYEMIKASLVHKGAFIRSIIVRSISIYNNDFDELIRPVILLLLENLKKDK